MTVQEVIKSLRLLGIEEICERNGRLAYRPRIAIPDDLRAAVHAVREELLQIVREFDGHSTEGGDVATLANSGRETDRVSPGETETGSSPHPAASPPIGNRGEDAHAPPDPKESIAGGGDMATLAGFSRETDRVSPGRVEHHQLADPLAQLPNPAVSAQEGENGMEKRADEPLAGMVARLWGGGDTRRHSRLFGGKTGRVSPGGSVERAVEPSESVLKEARSLSTRGVIRWVDSVDSGRQAAAEREILARADRLLDEVDGLRPPPNPSVHRMFDEARQRLGFRTPDERSLTAWLRKNAPVIAALWPEAPVDASWLDWRGRVGPDHVATLDAAWKATSVGTQQAVKPARGNEPGLTGAGIARGKTAGGED